MSILRIHRRRITVLWRGLESKITKVTGSCWSRIGCCWWVGRVIMVSMVTGRCWRLIGCWRRVGGGMFHIWRWGWKRVHWPLWSVIWILNCKVECMKLHKNFNDRRSNNRASGICFYLSVIASVAHMWLTLPLKILARHHRIHGIMVKTLLLSYDTLVCVLHLS